MIVKGFAICTNPASSAVKTIAFTADHSGYKMHTYGLAIL
jgi:hypothetical protein